VPYAADESTMAGLDIRSIGVPIRRPILRAAERDHVQPTRRRMAGLDIRSSYRYVAGISGPPSAIAGGRRVDEVDEFGL
jgi:hypothetical protein